MAEGKKHKVSAKKLQNVKILAGLIDEYNTVMIGTTVNLASAQLQKARKMLRGKAEIRYAKKSTALRALEAAKKKGITKIKEHVTESPALIFTNEDAYDLATTLSENKFPARAKAGQVAPKDISIEAGPTDLLPGPVLSELGAAGLKAGIVGGKIAIKEGKVLVKEGEKITPVTAGVLMKLEILPFEVGLDAQTAYDSNADKIYTQIKIDKAGSLANLQEAFGTAYQFAIHVGYPTSDTISQIIVNAGREANAMEKIAGEAKPAKAAEEKKEEPAKEEAPAAEEKPAEEKPAEQPAVEAQPATQESSSTQTTEEK